MPPSRVHSISPSAIHSPKQHSEPRFSDGSRFVAIFAPPAIAVASLIAWTVMVIIHIDVTYQESMGYWGMLLIVLSLAAIFPVAAITAGLSLITFRWRLPGAFVSAAGCLVFMLMTWPVIEWVRAAEVSTPDACVIFMGLLVLPPCLVGVCASAFLHCVADAAEKPSG